MTDYAADINTNDYLYYKNIYLTNPELYVKNNFIVKLMLDETNFNFDLPKEDGTDLRLLYYGATLHMWIGNWSKTGRKAVVFFKIPVLPANRTVKLFLYWGNSEAEDISEPAEMSFYFVEDFSESPLDSSLWEGRLTNAVNEYGYYMYYHHYPFITITDPLENLGSWRIEFGLYCDWGTFNNSNLAAFDIELQGTENDFWVGASDTRGISTAENGTTTTYKDGDYYGLEDDSYNEVTIDYDESQDRVVVKLKHRDNYPDVEYYWSRKVEGDTRPVNISVGGVQYGNNTIGPNPTYINWLVVRPFNSSDNDILDNTGLFIEHEYVAHQTVDVTLYGPDITSIMYSHESDFGGNPLLLSDNGYDSDANIWISDDDAIAEDYVSVTINTGWAGDITDTKYTHYDSGHVYHYNAAKLSDNDESLYGWTYLNLTTTSGWAAIKFNSSVTIGAFKIKATSNLEAAPKDFKFYGSHYNPVINYDEARVLAEGSFTKTEDWQFRILIHDLKYRYYILEVLNTHGNEDVEIQEWEMMESMGQRERRYVTQLRLHPAIVNDYEYNFPKQISLVATNDGYTWDTLLDWTNTYTPFISHVPEYGQWQRYSFTNMTGYWSFKLLCKGNWLSETGHIAIGEWEMCEIATEAFTYHILAGTSDNITQVWAHENCTLDDVYSIFFATNGYVSRVAANRLVGYDTLPEDYNDINVVQENY
jgi:hypothetical protein